MVAYLAFKKQCGFRRWEKWIEQSAIFLKTCLAGVLDKTGVEILADPKGKQPTFNYFKPDMPSLKCQDVGWSKPPPGWCELNFDAGFWEDVNKASWGAILRDEGGNVILSAWGRLDHCLNAEMAEALAGKNEC